MDLEEIIRGELAENVDREDFQLSEVNAIRLAYKDIIAAAAKERQREHGGTAPGKHSPKISGSDDRHDRETAAKIGAFANLSGRSVEKIAAVCDAAEANPEPVWPSACADGRDKRQQRPQAESRRRSGTLHGRWLGAAGVKFALPVEDRLAELSICITSSMFFAELRSLQCGGAIFLVWPGVHC